MYSAVRIPLVSSCAMQIRFIIFIIIIIIISSSSLLWLDLEKRSTEKAGTEPRCVALDAFFLGGGGGGRSPAISLGFTIFGWDFCVCDRFF